MKKIKYIVFVLLTLSILLTACSAGAPSQPEAETQFAVYALHSEPLTNWDPAIEFSNGILIHNNIYEQLLRYDPVAEETIPWLAESYTVSDDSLTWTFKLREGVKFQNGDAVTAEDVKYSIDRTMALGAGASYIWFPVENITVVDPLTVEFSLSYPAPLNLIATTGYAAFVYSSKCVDENNEWMDDTAGCGTGPYAIKSASWGDEIILEKFDDYWAGWGEKHFSTVVFKKVTEPATRRQMIETGEATITTYLPYSDVNALKENDKVSVYVEPSFQNLLGMFNTQKPPLDDVKVRQALAHAFPYDEVIKSAMGGYARQAYGAVPYGLWGWDESLPQYDYDLEKAKELLAEAGYADGGFKLLLTYLAGDEAEKNSAELYKSELAKLNIELEIRSMPWDSQWELAKASDLESRQDIFMMYWWPDLPSPYSFLYSTFHSEEEVLFNLSYYYVPEFDAMIDEANELTSTDLAKAESMFVDAQKMLLEDAASLFIYDQQDLWITVSNLKGFTYNPAYPTTMFFHNMYLE